jgi:3-methyladenine DNA glycosylase/8-oxoguanine DNA glycosylase
MHTDALAHLRAADPRLAAVIDRVGDCAFEARAEGTHFGAVARAIVYQQLSGKAAGTIHRRFEELYGGRAPTAEELLATPEERLRGVGLSRQKTSYLKDLAARVAAGEVPIESLDAMADDEVVETLVRVKGVGRWTAQMFLMFRLGRPDVLPDLDLGVQKGLQLAHGLKTLPKPRDVTRLGEAWAPYRSIASWYLWRLLDNGDGQGTPVKRPAEKGSAEKRSAVGGRRSAEKKAAAKKWSAKKVSARKTNARTARPAKAPATGGRATPKRATPKRATPKRATSKRATPQRPR